MITPRHAASIGSRYFSGNLAGALAGVAVAGLFLLTPAAAQAQVPDATKPEAAKTDVPKDTQKK